MAKNLYFCFTPIKSPENRIREFSGANPSLLIKNFNSLYENFSATPDRRSTPESGYDSGGGTAVPDFATAIASRRFFFSTPGRSNSIVDSSLSPASTPPSGHPENGGGVAVPTYSPDPFVDFRRSMQEMVEAREVHDVRESWGYLHELLTRYLSLNPKSTHKFIVGAFADLLVSLLAEEGRRETPFSGEVTRQCVEIEKRRFVG